LVLNDFKENLYSQNAPKRNAESSFSTAFGIFFLSVLGIQFYSANEFAVTGANEFANT
jgi:hypothetical protein